MLLIIRNMRLALRLTLVLLLVLSATGVVVLAENGTNPSFSLTAAATPIRA